MVDRVLYHMPGACSRVTITALEHTGIPYRDVALDLAVGDQHDPEYRALNPRGKIPCLVIDGRTLTENAAILTYIDSCNPDAGLFPPREDLFAKTKVLSDLFWISSGWHPAVRAMRMPIRWTVGDPEPVVAKGRELLTPMVAQLEGVLAAQPWWYGEEWSIVDVYFYWCYTTASEGGFDLSAFPGILRHRAAVEGHRSFQEALVREQRATERAMAK